MSSKGKEPARYEFPLEEEEIATHQEAVPVPYLAGTRRVALRWITPASSMVTQIAPDEKPGKK